MFTSTTVGPSIISFTPLFRRFFLGAFGAGIEHRMDQRVNNREGALFCFAGYSFLPTGKNRPYCHSNQHDRHERENSSFSHFNPPKQFLCLSTTGKQQLCGRPRSCCFRKDSALTPGYTGKTVSETLSS
jgi:hypothetical protein